jgi:hypothetical protein
MMGEANHEELSRRNYDVPTHATWVCQYHAVGGTGSAGKRHSRRLGVGEPDAHYRFGIH